MKRFTIGMIVIGIVFPLCAYIIEPSTDVIWWFAGCAVLWIVVIFVDWIKKR